MHPQAVNPLREVSTAGAVVVDVRGLAEEIEAVKLVEDFEADAVAFDACAGVGHFEDGGWLIDFSELGGGDHLVADYMVLVYWVP